MANINELLYGWLSLNPKIKALTTKGESTLVTFAGVEIGTADSPINTILVDDAGDVITSFGGGGAGGGSIVYTNASGDFTATANNGTSTITITGLPFVLEELNVIGGSIKKRVPATALVTDVDLGKVAVSGGVITLADADAFVTDDEVYVSLIGPDKWYAQAQDAAKFLNQNPEWAHYTNVETIISTTNLGITGTADGTSASTVLEDTGAAFAEAEVAVGYLAYSEEEDATSVVEGVTSGTICATDATVSDWDGDTYWLPECQRAVINAEGYNHLAVHTRLGTTAVGNSAFVKIYGTLDADADATDDTYWVDLSDDIFGAAQLTCTGASGTQEGIYFVDTSTPILKYMVKVVGEVNDNGAGAIGAQSFDIYIKKSS